MLLLRPANTMYREILELLKEAHWTMPRISLTGEPALQAVPAIGVGD